MPRLSFSSPLKGVRKDSIACGNNDAFAQIRLNCSLIALEDCESAVEDLLREVDDAIHKQTSQKEFMEKIIEANIKMAKARYAGGSEMGAILSMRKVHKDTSRKAYICAARFRLTALRQEIQSALDLDRCEYVLVDAQRNGLRGILSDLETATYNPMPPNHELLKQLSSIMADERRW